LIIAYDVGVHVLEELLTRYVDYLDFTRDLHNLLVYPCTTNDKAKAKIPFCITEKDILEGAADWMVDYQHLFIEVQTQFEVRTKVSQKQRKVMAAV
jgi:hypothetical protein